MKRTCMRDGLWPTCYLLLAIAVTTPLRADSTAEANESPSNSKPEAEKSADAESTTHTKKVRLARLVLKGSLSEGPGGGGLLGELGTDLRRFIARIDKAAADDTIDGLLLEIKGASLSPGRRHELRQAIGRFRKSGKKAYAYFEAAYSGDYLVAVACDEIYMPPSGDIAIPGVYTELTFFKGLFDMLGIKADFMHMGEAKGAGEPFTRKKMSKPVRDNLTDMVEDLYLQLIENIATGRKLPAEKVKQLIDQGLFMAHDAQKADLVDGLLYEDELREVLAKRHDTDHLVYVVNYGRHQVDTDFSGTMGMFKLLQAIMGSGPQRSTRGSKVAVVYAVGPIFSGKSVSDIFGQSIMGSDTIVEALRKANDDDSVKAIVLRVDSPGGSALGSDMIWRATTTLDKPIVASMGDVAGSGGYYIAMGCNKIYAEPGTITGSIGVVGGKITMKGLFDKLGISTDSISRGANAGMFASSGKWSESEKGAIRNMMKVVYEQFTTKAAQGRHMPIERLQELAGGKVYTGRDAKQLNLIDELGTLRDAVDAAKRLAGIGADEKVELMILPESPSFFEALFGDAGQDQREVRSTLSHAALKQLGNATPLSQSLQRAHCLQQMFANPSPVLVMPYFLEIR